MPKVPWGGGGGGWRMGDVMYKRLISKKIPCNGCIEK
jgi:hypothetical protein